MGSRSLFLAGAILAAAASATQLVTKDTPVTKVVELIQEMKAKIEADGKAEQKVYDKFACWCEKTTARKAGAIDEAKASIEELSTTVLTLKGKTATMKAEAAQLEKDIAANIDGANEATSIREKETADYEGAFGPRAGDWRARARHRHPHGCGREDGERPPGGGDLERRRRRQGSAPHDPLRRGLRHSDGGEPEHGGGVCQ